ncbi:hypothetical protein [Methanolobus psychrotolerans]|uniref:hypothetical protein n=1 Tax=Methanolobus psychrotolerans TaxID=1874706 RepID=UPI000B91BDA2|nr:hypothetical protein [Methanolobus psychrotolerans]
MSTWDWIKIFNSETRREILNILSKKDMSATSLYNNMQSSKIKYRQTIYKELQFLVDVGALEKYYDNDSKQLMYKLIVSKIVIDLKNMNIDVIKHE